MGVPPVIIHFNRLFHYKPSIWATPIDADPHMFREKFLEDHFCGSMFRTGFTDRRGAVINFWKSEGNSSVQDHLILNQVVNGNLEFAYDGVRPTASSNCTSTLLKAAGGLVLRFAPGSGSS